jgi:hypothetical protein
MPSVVSVKGFQRQSDRSPDHAPLVLWQTRWGYSLTFRRLLTLRISSRNATRRHSGVVDAFAQFASAVQQDWAAMAAYFEAEALDGTEKQLATNALHELCRGAGGDGTDRQRFTAEGAKCLRPRIEFPNHPLPC